MCERHLQGRPCAKCLGFVPLAAEPTLVPCESAQVSGRPCERGDMMRKAAPHSPVAADLEKVKNDHSTTIAGGGLDDGGDVDEIILVIPRLPDRPAGVGTAATADPRETGYILCEKCAAEKAEADGQQQQKQKQQQKQQQQHDGTNKRDDTSKPGRPVSVPSTESFTTAREHNGEAQLTRQSPETAKPTATSSYLNKAGTKPSTPPTFAAATRATPTLTSPTAANSGTLGTNTQAAEKQCTCGMSRREGVARRSARDERILSWLEDTPYGESVHGPDERGA